MPQGDSWWARQFVEGLKEIARVYDRFRITREVEDLHIAQRLQEDLNETYRMSMDLLDFIEIGRVLLGKQPLQHNEDNSYEQFKRYY